MAGETPHKIFSPEEKSILIDLIKEKRIIEDKRTDIVSVAKKKAAWEEIEHQFNSSNAVFKRTLAQLKKCWDNIKTKRKRDMATESRLIMKTGGGPPPPTASATPELELVVPHLGHNMGFWFDSDASAIRSLPVLSAPTCSQLDTAAAGSSFNAQDSQCTPVASESTTAGSSSQDQSCDASTDRDAPVTVEEGQNHPSLSTPRPKKRLSRESLVEDELEQRIKRHRFQMECDLKLQSLREKELQLLVENAGKEEERRRQVFEWEEERRKLAFEWEEERKKKAFEAEERRKEEMHVLQLELKKKSVI